MSNFKRLQKDKSACADSIAQRCLTFLRCWPISEVRRYELVMAALHSFKHKNELSDGAIQAEVLQDLRAKIQQEVGADDLAAVPRLRRRSMSANPWASFKSWPKKHTGGQPQQRSAVADGSAATALPARRFAWQGRALRRRLLLALLVFPPALLAAWGVSTVLPFHGGSAIEKALIVVSGLLFAWVSVGFWVALAGFVVLTRRSGRDLLGRDLPVLPTAISPGCRTAILFPICGEDMRRISAGVFSVYRSLQETGQMNAFDFFLLSDSKDPDAWVNEEIQWRQLSSDLGDPGNIFYRRRHLNIKRKSGNVADFCRRFGAAYRYMIVFDADSVMSGTSLVRLVQLMEHHPDVGIIQTPPAVVGRETLFARMQQFASRAYGPLFAAGLHALQLGDGSFWGHNAILRVEPFMEHCSLPRLPGKAPWGGDILSHDFVESALMRRAGWTVWLAYDMDGSYEEPPPTLVDEINRDRRWCSGNLQHLRLLFVDGFSAAHRWLFINGIMSYVSALLWMVLLLLSSAAVIVEAFRPPEYFPSGRALFPQWPVWDPFGPLALLTVTAVLLFFPKFLALLTIVRQKRCSRFGGICGMLKSLFVESLLSVCLAPLRMWFHCKFIAFHFLGIKTGWLPQNREDLSTGWRDATRFHGSGVLFAALWTVILGLISPGFLLWMMPIVIPLLLAVPISVLTSRTNLGQAARKHRLFLIPEETAPPPELVALMNRQVVLARSESPLRLKSTDGFVRAVLNPRINLLHRRLSGNTIQSRLAAGRRFLLLRKALNSGPEGLSVEEKKRILRDSLTLWMLHKAVWSLPEGPLTAKWFGRYTQRTP